MPPAILKRLDNKPISFDRYYDMTAPDFDELVAGKEHIKNIGAKIEKLVHKMPRLAAEATILPITRSVLSVELALTPDFMYDETVHGGSQGFHLLIEDSDGEQILYYQYWVLKKKYAQETQYVNFIIPLIEPMPPHYYLRICSDTWLKAETTHLISFRSLILPEKFPPHTELLDLQPLPLHALNNEAFERVLGGTLTTFNPIQTQVFSTVYESDANVLVAARSGAGKGVIGELALLRLVRHAAGRQGAVRLPGEGRVRAEACALAGAVRAAGEDGGRAVGRRARGHGDAGGVRCGDRAARAPGRLHEPRPAHEADPGGRGAVLSHVANSSRAD